MINKCNKFNNKLKKLKKRNQRLSGRGAAIQIAVFLANPPNQRDSPFPSGIQMTLVPLRKFRIAGCSGPQRMLMSAGASQRRCAALGEGEGPRAGGGGEGNGGEGEGLTVKGERMTVLLHWMHIDRGGLRASALRRRAAAATPLCVAPPTPQRKVDRP